MPWWAWLVLGIGLLGVEMFVIDAQFYLVFIGLSAAVVGLLGLVGVDLPQWAQWLVFRRLAVVAMLAFRRRLYEMVRNRGGPRGRAPDDRRSRGRSAAGSSRARAAASSTAARAGRRATPANRRSRPASEVVIARVDGLTLHVKAE